MTHPCPVPDCDVVDVRDDVLMCPKHWTRVADHIRQEFVAAFKEVVIRQNGTVIARLEAHSQYMKARAKAIAWAQRKETCVSPITT